MERNQKRRTAKSGPTAAYPGMIGLEPTLDAEHIANLVAPLRDGRRALMRRRCDLLGELRRTPSVGSMKAAPRNAHGAPNRTPSLSGGLFHAPSSKGPAFRELDERPTLASIA